MTSGRPSETQILHALQASGYLFEQDVSSTLERLGFHVETNPAFLDRELEKSRELDARAVKVVHTDEREKIQVVVELLVECKDMDAPLVFITREKNSRERQYHKPAEFLFPRSTYASRLTPSTVQEKAAFIHFQLAQEHYYYRECEKATQFAKIIRKGSEWYANHEGIYDSLILPMAKALEARKSAVKSMVHGGVVWLFFPMVVLRENLFALRAGETTSMPEARQRVSFVRELDSEVVKGHYMTDFIVHAHLEKFIREDIMPFASAVVKIAKSSPKELRGNST